MAAPHIKRQIDLVILLTALAMLVLGILMIVAPFEIKHQSDALPNRDLYRDGTFFRLYCEINVSETSHQSWAGFMVFLTSLFVVASQATNNEQTWLPKALVKLLRHKKMVCPILVLISMFSAMVIMTQEAYTMGRIRNYKIHQCFRDGYSDGRDGFVDKKDRLSRLLAWFYILVIPSNFVLVLCLIQIVAFFTKWILRTSSNIEQQQIAGTDDNLESPSQEPSTSDDIQPQPISSVQQNGSIGMRCQPACHHGQPYPPPPDCAHRCPYHTPQPPYYHQCHHSGFPIAFRE